MCIGCTEPYQLLRLRFVGTGDDDELGTTINSSVFHRRISLSAPQSIARVVRSPPPPPLLSASSSIVGATNARGQIARLTTEAAHSVSRPERERERERERESERALEISGREMGAKHQLAWSS